MLNNLKASTSYLDSLQVLIKDYKQTQKQMQTQPQITILTSQVLLSAWEHIARYESSSPSAQKVWPLHFIWSLSLLVILVTSSVLVSQMSTWSMCSVARDLQNPSVTNIHLVSVLSSVLFTRCLSWWSRWVALAGELSVTFGFEPKEILITFYVAPF